MDIGDSVVYIGNSTSPYNPYKNGKIYTLSGLKTMICGCVAAHGGIHGDMIQHCDRCNSPGEYGDGYLWARVESFVLLQEYECESEVLEEMQELV